MWSFRYGAVVVVGGGEDTSQKHRFYRILICYHMWNVLRSNFSRKKIEKNFEKFSKNFRKFFSKFFFENFKIFENCSVFPETEENRNFFEKNWFWCLKLYIEVYTGIFLTVFRLLIASINFVFVSFGIFWAQFWIFELSVGFFERSFAKKIAQFW